MRWFIAIELEEAVRQSAEKVQDQIRTASAEGRFTEPANFHLTIRFIGSGDEALKNRLKEAVDQAAYHSRPFNLNLSGPGQFIKGSKAIVWLGVAGEMSALNALYKELEQALAHRGIQAEERPYRPHITLGKKVRLKENQSLDELPIVVEEAKIAVRSLSLMESLRVNGKLVYRPIYRRSLSDEEAEHSRKRVSDRAPLRMRIGSELERGKR